MIIFKKKTIKFFNPLMKQKRMDLEDLVDRLLQKDLCYKVDYYH